MGLKSLIVGSAAAVLVATIPIAGRAQSDDASQSGAVGASEAAGTSTDTGAAPVATEPTDIEGFRSARFGMVEADILAAIAQDFGTPSDQIARTIHPLERTTSLIVNVPDLLPGTGTAQILYILGFESDALIQVNVIWGAPVDPDFDPAQVTAAAKALRDHFLRQAHVEGSVIGNVRLGQDMLLLFSGADADGHQVALSLGGVAFVEDAEGSGTLQQIDTTDRLTLRLSYVADADSPDILRPDADDF